jgi:competence protein ComEC
MQAAAGLRSAVERSVHSHLAPDDAALLLGMLLSERGSLPADLVDTFTRTGTVHILSVSGMHVAVIAAMLLWVFRTLTVPRKTAHVFCIIAVWLFALAASGGGGNPPAFRAALCATVFFAAPLLRRDAEPRHSLAFAALILLVADPQTLFDPGAQLSFATVGTILLWHSILERLFFPWEPGMSWSARFSRGVVAALMLGVVAHLGSWPLAAFYFHQFSVVAPLANLAVSFLADALVVGGLVFSATPGLPWWPITQGLSLLRVSAQVFAAPSWAAFSVASLPILPILLYYVLLGGLTTFVRAHISAPRRLFTPSAPAQMDTGNSDRSTAASHSAAPVDAEDRS